MSLNEIQFFLLVSSFFDALVYQVCPVSMTCGARLSRSRCVTRVVVDHNSDRFARVQSMGRGRGGLDGAQLVASGVGNGGTMGRGSVTVASAPPLVQGLGTGVGRGSSRRDSVSGRGKEI